MNQYRNLISVLVGISFLLVGATGVIMKFFTKGYFLNQVHTWIGLVMVAAAVAHLVLNWKPFSGYFRDRRIYALAVPFLAFLLLTGMQREQGGGHGPVALRKLAQARACDLAPAFGKSAEEAVAELRGAGLKVGGGDQTIEQIGRENHQRPEAVLNLLAR